MYAKIIYAYNGFICIRTHIERPLIEKGNTLYIKLHAF